MFTHFRQLFQQFFEAITTLEGAVFGFARTTLTELGLFSFWEEAIALHNFVTFFVFPEYRGIGLGNELIRLLVEFLKEKNCSECYLWTTNDLLSAVNAYLKYGFKLVEEKPSVNFGKNLVEQKYTLKLPKSQ